jgi:tRNA U34 5-methylaminomethyl-2-thiouridine-forming methyltransferase MnmC
MNLVPEKTGDGSETYRNPVVDELYHTKSGAVTEAIEKYSKPLKVWLKEKPVILDICFGLGYNAAAAIDIIRTNNNNSRVKVYCLENDKGILEKSLDVNPGFKSYPLIQKFIKNFLREGKEVLVEDNVELVMLFGDALKEINKVKGGADYVFLDPFSPKKQPELWGKKFMEDIYAALKGEGSLATYSYARIVKNNLESAGFKVVPGPVIGRRSPSTIAYKHKKTL